MMQSSGIAQQEKDLTGKKKEAYNQLIYDPPNAYPVYLRAFSQAHHIETIPLLHKENYNEGIQQFMGACTVYYRKLRAENQSMDAGESHLRSAVDQISRRRSSSRHRYTYFWKILLVW